MSKEKAVEKKESDVEERLLEGEEVLAQAVIHWGIYWKSGAVFLLALIFYALVAPELGLLLIAVSILMVLYATIKKKILLLVVTDRRVFVRYGILEVDVVDIHFDKVESIELERMLPGFIMGYSNVVMLGTGQRYIVIPYVANGPQIRRAYNEKVLGDKNRKEL